MGSSSSSGVGCAGSANKAPVDTDGAHWACDVFESTDRNSREAARRDKNERGVVYTTG